MATNGEKISYPFNPYRREVMKPLCLTKLSGADFRVLLLILAQTDGYHRSQDKIKPDFFTKRTGMNEGNVRRTIARLRKLNIVTKNDQFYEVLTPDQWDGEVFVDTQYRFNLEAPTASNLKRPEVEIDAVLASSKENSTKENLLKNGSTGSTGQQVDGRSTEFLKVKKQVLNEYRDRLGYPNPTDREDARAITWMLEHGYTQDQILHAYDWLKLQPFWRDKHPGMQSVKNQIDALLKRYSANRLSKTEKIKRSLGKKIEYLRDS